MTLLTPEECRKIAERKMVEAEGRPGAWQRIQRATAHAWLVLAEMIESMPERPTGAIPPDKSPARDQ